MFCPNEACEKLGVDVADDKFCCACGTKCSDASPPRAIETDRRQSAEMAGGSGTSVKNIVSGDQHNTTAVVGSVPSRPATDFAPPGNQAGATKNIVGGNQHITNTTVVNQDETRAVRVCAVSGRQARVIEGYICPSCSKWVHLDYFDQGRMICSSCLQSKSDNAVALFKRALEQALNDGVLSREEVAALKETGTRLGISEQQQANILSELKSHSRPELRSLSLLDKTKLEAARLQLSQTNDLDRRGTALKTLKVLQKAYPANLEIASLLLLSAALSFTDENFMDYVEEGQRLFRDSEAFSYDSPQKYLLQSAFYRIAGLLLATQNIMPSGLGSAELQNIIESFNYNYHAAASSLDGMFPDSGEALALRLTALIDHFYEADKSASNLDEISQVLSLSISEPQHGAPHLAISLLRQVWPDEHQEKILQAKTEPYEVEGRLLYEALFGTNLWSLKEAPEAKLSEAIQSGLVGEHIPFEVASSLDSLRQKLKISKARYQELLQAARELKRSAANDIQQKVCDIVSKYEQLISDRTLYFAQGIPDKKLHKLYQACVGSGHPGPAWAVLYESNIVGVFGLYITADALYIRELGEERKQLPFNGTSCIAYHTNKIGFLKTRHLVVDDTIVFSFSETKEPAARLLCEMLQEFVNAQNA